MLSQKVNRYSRNSHKKRVATFSLRDGKTRPVKDPKTGFIHHPAGHPLEIRRLWFRKQEELKMEDSSSVGVIFESEKYIRPGIHLEITVPLGHEEEKFRGQVVLVRQNHDKYDIGLWLSHRAEASRARIVEQLCHIEHYLKEKKYRDGPYAINRDKLAEEWIINNASNVPTV